jgi:hypothetical protein
VLLDQVLRLVERMRLVRAPRERAADEALGTAEETDAMLDVVL